MPGWRRPKCRLRADADAGVRQRNLQQGMLRHKTGLLQCSLGCFVGDTASADWSHLVCQTVILHELHDTGSVALPPIAGSDKRPDIKGITVWCNLPREAAANGRRPKAWGPATLSGAILADCSTLLSEVNRMRRALPCFRVDACVVRFDGLIPTRPHAILFATAPIVSAPRQLR